MKQVHSYAASESPADRDADALEARFGAHLSHYLNERSEQLPHDVSERLRFARGLALKRASDLRRLHAQAVLRAEPAWTGMGRSAALSGGPEQSPWWLKFASFVPLLGLVLGLVLIQEHQLHEQIVAAADMDVALLADNLPPTAYSDPGFSEYLAVENE